MPRTAERLASAIAEDRQTGWILVQPPAAAPGWYLIRGIVREQTWVSIDCGRGAAYVVPAHVRLQWAPVEPPEDWSKPW